MSENTKTEGKCSRKHGIDSTMSVCMKESNLTNASFVNAASPKNAISESIRKDTLRPDSVTEKDLNVTSAIRVLPRCIT